MLKKYIVKYEISNWVSEKVRHFEVGAGLKSSIFIYLLNWRRLQTDSFQKPNSLLLNNELGFCVFFEVASIFLQKYL